MQQRLDVAGGEIGKRAHGSPGLVAIAGNLRDVGGMSPVEAAVTTALGRWQQRVRPCAMSGHASSLRLGGMND